MSRIQEGYLILADIAGYTAFLTGTELEHAQEIIEELITLILKHIQPPLKFVKLEGDAVFCYAPGTAFLDDTRLVEALEACYFAFRDHIQAMERSTTCRCAACRAIPSLDLKIIAHYGSYIMQRIAGVEDLAGRDVILAHRLLKNEITAQTGVPAYLFLSDACLAQLSTAPALPRYAETYDHLGEVAGGVHNLGAAWRAHAATRREYISPDRADLIFTYDLPAPPLVVWDYKINPAKALRWQGDLQEITHQPAANGRMDIGASTHCAHGDFQVLHYYIDWCPFRYYTERAEQPPGPLSPKGPPSASLATHEFVSLDGVRTRHTWRIRIIDRDPTHALAHLPQIRAGLEPQFLGNMGRLEQLLIADRAAFAGEAAPDPDQEGT